MKQTAYSYVRMSSAAQLKGDSLRRQIEASQKYAHANNLDIDQNLDLRDLGVSAYNGDNADTGALSRFMAAIDSGRVAAGSVLLVESLDRLSRQRVGAAMSLFLSIVERGISIVTLADGNVYRPGSSDPMPLIQSLLIMSRAHEESQIKSQRLTAAWESKRRNLANVKLTSRCPGWLQLEGDRKSFGVIPERAQVVRKIFDLAEAGLGHFSICRKLNSSSVQPFGRSAWWGESYVEKILHNRAVFGEFQPHRKVDGRRLPLGEPIVGYYPSVVSEDQFLRVQAQRKMRGTNSGGRRGSCQTNLFTHIARCAECGSSMRLINKGKPPKGGRYLRCSGALLGLGCSAAPWRYETFETAFLSFCSEADLASVAEAEEDTSSARVAREKLAADTERLALAVARREKIFGLIDTTSDMDFLQSKLDVCNTEILELNANIASNKPTGKSERTDVKLFDQIRFFQSANDAPTLEARVRMATRLRNIITSLHLGTNTLSPAPAGDVLSTYPQLQRIIQMDRSSDGLPAFVVQFVDGTRRYVSVARGDGTGFGRIIEFPGSGMPEVKWAMEP